MRFLPLRADAGSQRFLGDGIVLRRTNPRLQSLQHGAVRRLLNALRQANGLRGGTIQYCLNGGRISTIAECGADLLRDSRAGCRVLQAFCTLPLCGNAGSERFLGSAVALRGTYTCLQGLQHRAISGLFDALWQLAYLRRSTVQYRFDGGCISLVSEGRTDLLGDGGTGNRVLQGVRFLPLRANAGSQRFLCGAVALRGTDTRLQGLQHRAIGGLFDTLRQCAHLRRSTVQHRFDGGRVSLVTEGSTDLLGDGGTGNWVLQGVGFLPLRADTGGERFLCDAVALHCADTRLQGLQHRAISGLFDALRQCAHLRSHTPHGIACRVFAWRQADAGGLFVCAVRRYLAWRELNAGTVGSCEARCCLA